MPQPNWQKLVTQGRAQAIGVPLSDTVTVTAPSASVPKELEPSPLTPEEKAFLEAQEKEENEGKTPENDVPAPQATDAGESTENATIDEKTAESDAKQPSEEVSGPQKPEETTVSDVNTAPANAPKAEDMTFSELKKALTELGQTIPFGANKAKLVEMFNAIP